MIFCPEGSAMVEFVAGAKVTNSALYAGYASVFGLCASLPALPLRCTAEQLRSS